MKISRAPTGRGCGIFARGREYRYYVSPRVSSGGRQACSVRSVPADAIEEFVVKQIRSVAERPEMLARVTDILQQQYSQRAPGIEQELAQLTSEHRRCRETTSSLRER